MKDSTLTVVTSDNIFVTSELTDALDKQLKTIGQGAFHEEAAAAQQEIMKKLALGKTDIGKLTLEITYSKKEDNDTVNISGTVKVSTGYRKYTTSSFITKNYLPSRDRQEENK